MPEPKGRRTKGKQRSRRSHLTLKPLTMVSCTHCKKPKLPHKLCLNCGYYNDREIIDVTKKETKKAEKIKQKTKS